MTISAAVNFKNISKCTNVNICTKHHLFLDADEDDLEKENTEMKLDGSIISFEFAPLTKSIKISNIAQGTSPDDIKFKFVNQKIGGGKVTDITLDKNNGVAIIYFEKASGRTMHGLQLHCQRKIYCCRVINH